MTQATSPSNHTDNAMFVAVYERLKQLAHQQLAQDQRATLNTTSLVHELYEKLVQRQQGETSIENFFAYAAVCMRRIVIDHARARLAQKAGGLLQRVTLSAAEDTESDQLALDVLQLDKALVTLSEIEPRAAKVVELRYFIGLGVEEIAQMLQLNRRTVLRDWDFAKAYLHAAISDDL